jgi:hypothetical protein
MQTYVPYQIELVSELGEVSDDVARRIGRGLKFLRKFVPTVFGTPLNIAFTAN